MSAPPLSLYVHVPWCVRKCPYCDFNSHPLGPQGLPEARYLQALLEDLAEEAGEASGRALLALPERQQELIRLLYVKELTQKAAAAELGITQQAAAAMKARAIKKLKEVLTR